MPAREELCCPLDDENAVQSQQKDAAAHNENAAKRLCTDAHWQANPGASSRTLGGVGLALPKEGKRTLGAGRGILTLGAPARKWWGGRV